MSLLGSFRTPLALASFAWLASLAYLVAASSCATNNSPTGAGGAHQSTGSDGTGGGIPAHCTGSAPVACDGLNAFDCATTHGCVGQGSCLGTAVDCATLTTMTACTDSGGCAWQPQPLCSGSATPCANFFDPSTCAQQKGCTFDLNFFQCNGTETPCAQISDASTCGAQLGCAASETTSCTGLATTCTAIMTDAPCAKQSGCTWMASCTGMPTSCEFLTPDNCGYQPGCVCEGCPTVTSPVSSGVPTTCTKQADCDPINNWCFTGNCINAVCEEPPNCRACAKQLDCDPKSDPCLTGNCVNSRCEALTNCQQCKVESDCDTTANKCFTGNCINASCEAKTLCVSGDGCCPDGCAGMDSDCP